MILSNKTIRYMRKNGEITYLKIHINPFDDVNAIFFFFFIKFYFSLFIYFILFYFLNPYYGLSFPHR